MRRILIMLILLGVVALVAVPSSTPARGQALPFTYAFTSFDVPGCPQTAPFGNNDRAAGGQIVGLCFPVERGFLFRAGTYQFVDFPGSSASLSAGINNASQIVGRFYGTGCGAEGYLLVGGVFTIIDDPAAGCQTEAHGINKTGQIIGTIDNAHGYLSSGGTFTTIDGPGANHTEMWKINDLGQAVGFFGDFCCGTPDRRGLLYFNGTITAFDFPGATSTQALGINNNGEIVGNYRDGGGRTHGFLLSGGIFYTIDVPSSFGATLSALTSINNDGDLVGFWDDVGGSRHGFTALRTIPFATFSAEVLIFRASRSFAVSSRLTPGSSGIIAPLTQDVTFQLGGFATTIPAGSFRQQTTRFGTVFVFFGTINSVGLAAQITPLGGGNYSFGIVGSAAPNLPSANPVTVKLTIGNNSGSVAVNATFR